MSADRGAGAGIGVRPARGGSAERHTKPLARAWCREWHRPLGSNHVTPVGDGEVEQAGEARIEVIPAEPVEALATQIAQRAGMALAGHSPAYVTAAQARALGNSLPAGAQVNRQANTITFSSRTVSFTVIAVPPGGPDMTFRIGGLVNPTLVIQHDASVQVQFINADPDQAHGWQITSAEPPFEFDPGPVAITGASARPLGDPTPAGDGAETITFQGGKPGTYHYVCPMPGHAQMGMNGALDIR